MGYQPQADGSAREQFLGDFAAHTGRVRAIYNQVLGVGER